MTRSYLYVPGDDATKLAKAQTRGADALICDLEDAVALARKPAARDAVAAAVEPLARAGGEVWVRITRDSLASDIAAVSRPGLTGIVVPKATPELLAQASLVLDGLPEGAGVRLIALVETALGVLSVARMAAMPRVARLGLGEADLAAELGMRPGRDGTELLAIRSQVVVASAAAGLPGPIAGVWLEFRDVAGLRESTQALLRLGFRGRTAVHPGQVPVINEVFTPAPQEVAEAREAVAVFDEARAGGTGVYATADGRMVDLAVVRSAWDVLRRAEDASRAGAPGLGEPVGADGSRPSEAD